MSIANRREYLRQPVGRSPVDEFLRAMPIGGTRSGILGAAAPSFSPDDIASLAHWYDATQITGSDGDAIGTWSDQEGTDDLAQSTSSEKPTLKTNILNGKQVLRFDGTDDNMEVSFTTVTQPVTTFAVASQTQTVESAFVFDSESVATDSLNNHWREDTSNWVWRAGTSIEGGSNDGSSHFILTGLFDGASSTGRIDGTQVTSGDLGTDDLEGLRVGRRKNDSNELTGDIAELLFYDADLSDADRDDVESYLSDKWGITI